jgi:hypothetical protein
MCPYLYIDRCDRSEIMRCGMLNRRTIAHVKNVVEDLELFLQLLKTDGGHLTEAGKAVIREGLARGVRNKELAELLSVSPAAVTRYSH